MFAPHSAQGSTSPARGCAQEARLHGSVQVLPERSLAWRKLAIGLLLALLAAVSTVGTLNDVGVTWDEPLYIKASRGYMTWLGVLKNGLLRRDLSEALADTTIVRWWVQDPTLELHPPVGKLLSGLTWAAFRKVLGDIPAHRLSNALLFSLLVAMVFWMVSSGYGASSGAFAAMSLLLMPRMFFHAHLANIDTTVAITWFATMYLFWKYEPRPGWLPVVIIGVAYGLALGTKLNAAVMPFVWVAWTLLVRRSWRALLRLIPIGMIGILVFLAIWPWLYHDTANRLVYYFLMASRFKDRPQFYLGQTLSHVPWHYPFVLTLAVVPLTTTVMYLIGAARIIGSRDQLAAGDSTSREEGVVSRMGWLLLLNAAVPLLVAATGLQASYSGERHFIPTYPYLACLAGVGFGTTLNALSAASSRWYDGLQLRNTRWIIGLFLALLLLPPLVSLACIHPYELSYYSELVGGLRGATRMGLETTFWCETYLDALPYLNEHAAAGVSVWAENPYVLRLYQREQMLRQDLQVIGGDTISPFAAHYAVVEMRQTGFSYTPEVVDVMQQYTPVYTLAYQGVPLMHIYKLDASSTCASCFPASVDGRPRWQRRG